MSVLVSILGVLLAAAGGAGEKPVCGLTCYDPEGLCAGQGCAADCSCSRDGECPDGYLCGPFGAGRPSSCWCSYSEARGVWFWNCTDDLVATCVPIPAPTGPRGYTITDLGTLGGSVSIAHGINNRGEVVGEAGTSAGPRHPFLWRDGVMTDLWPGASGDGRWASDINNKTQILIVTDTTSYLWDTGTRVQIRGFNPGGSAKGNALNDVGQVVGDTYVMSAGAHHAFLWQGGVLQDLTVLSGRDVGASDINSAGWITGTVSGGVWPRAFVWRDDSFVELGTLFEDAGASYGTELNDLGELIGRATRAYQEDGPFLSSGGTMIDLDELAGFPLGNASAINNCGDVLTSGIRRNAGRLYHPDYGFRLLVDLIPAELRWYDLFGEGINDAGQIVGVGTLVTPHGTLRRAFLLNPVPGDLAPGGSIDLRDFAIFQKRFSGAAPPGSGCLRGDLDRDDDVDLRDFAFLQNAFAGTA